MPFARLLAEGSLLRREVRVSCQLPCALCPENPAATFLAASYGPPTLQCARCSCAADAPLFNEQRSGRIRSHTAARACLRPSLQLGAYVVETFEGLCLCSYVDSDGAHALLSVLSTAAHVRSCDSRSHRPVAVARAESDSDCLSALAVRGS